ncbi:MAG: peptidylprolyl isomerase [Leptotrichia sp.]|jgi:putative chaperone surA|uniref:Peptidylprolyl isomerase n=1 Tax=Leptotrichia rugosa TaxID=3239302 RepID=A0AB39VG87_9FUSO|nr:peptidylprolyl isomerase [Leptotrichia sp. oral taxon 498]ASQ48307.1 peptidylprolyl isomerase [Leptotrichia sp. oral taxon 498]RKW35977.1 MAG: peptidylprolyl isomerase [Leptotrichia sp.]
MGNSRKMIKKLSIIMIVVFAIGMLASAILFLKNTIFGQMSNREVIVTVNNEKIYKDQFESYRQILKDQLSQLNQQKAQMGIPQENLQDVPDSITDEIILQNLISKALLISAASDFKIKVPNGEINRQVNKEIKGVKKEELMNALAARGYRNLTDYKNAIKQSKIMQKLQEKMFGKYQLSDADVKKAFDREQYAGLAGKDYNDIKVKLKESLQQDRNDALLNSYLVKLNEKAKIEFKNPEIKKIYNDSKVIVARNGEYKILNKTVNERVLKAISESQDGYSEKLLNDIKANLKVELDKLVKISVKAKAAGLKPDPELVGVDQLQDLSKRYYNSLIDNFKVDDATLKAKFEQKKDSYSIQSSVGGYVIGDEYQPSSQDLENAKKQAQEIMKTTNKNNFAQKAKEFSKDPGSATKGGSLGETTDLSGLVPEFANAVKNGKAGDIVGPIQTQFGYHIIYIESKDANNPNVAKVSHILITPNISEATKQKVAQKVNDLKAQVQSGKVTWDQVEKQDRFNFNVKERFKKLLKGETVPGIGKDDELVNKLFASKLNEIIEKNLPVGYFLVVKTSEIPFTPATFENSKERARLELAHEFAEKTLASIN